MIRDYTYHPVHRGLEHVDFVQVKLDQPVDVERPARRRSARPRASRGGHRPRRLPHGPRALPAGPDSRSSSRSTSRTSSSSEHVSTQDLKLPEGVTVRLPAEQTLIAVVDAGEGARGGGGGRPRQRPPRPRCSGRGRGPAAPRRRRRRSGRGRQGWRGPGRGPGEGREEEVRSEASGGSDSSSASATPAANTQRAGTTSASWSLDALRARCGAARLKEKFSGVFTRGELARPARRRSSSRMTFMNLSGDSVQPAMAFLKVAPPDVVVLHDELDLALRRRAREGGGRARGAQRPPEHHRAAGLAGLRPRPGRHRPAAAGLLGDVADWVLSGFDADRAGGAGRTSSVPRRRWRSKLEVLLVGGPPGRRTERGCNAKKPK